MVGRDEVVYGDWAAIVGGAGSVEAAARALLGPDGADVGAGVGEAVVAGYRAAVAAALPSGVSLRAEVFTGPAPRPGGRAGAIRSAVSSVGLREVIAWVRSDVQAAPLLRIALRRAENEVTRVRDAQRDNALRRHGDGVPKARIARDLGVQRVTVDAWLRRAKAVEPGTPAPSPTAAAAASAAAVRGGDHDTGVGSAAASSMPSPRPRECHRLTRPAVLGFDPATVRMRRWPHHRGGWLVYAEDDRTGHPILIGHLEPQEKRGGRIAGWQPLDEQRRRLGTATVPKTRPAAVAELLRMHDQRRRAAAARLPRRRGGNPTGENS